jgi:NADH-quinone oxidoreductase subunit L
VDEILTYAQAEPAGAVTYAPADGLLSSVWLLVAIPLVSAAILLLLGRRADRWGHWLGVAAIGAAFVLGLTYFFQLSGLENKSVERSLWDFIAVGDFKVDFGLLFDPLAAVFVLRSRAWASSSTCTRSGTWPRTPVGAGSSATSTSSSRRCCCWSSATTT